MSVVTRFPPSPTGYLHIGGARTALFNWLYARRHGGRFILRIEDTDRERSTEEMTSAILEAMNWLGLDWDDGPYFQSERQDLYNAHIDRMLQGGTAYYCECTPEEVEAMREEARAQGRKPKYSGRCRERGLARGEGRVVRFKAPLDGNTVFEDLVKGPQSWNNAELDDFILRRPDGSATYNMAVVADDAELGVTHILRGDDHLSNTPKQVLLYRAMGLEPPAFGHVPMILGPDRKKLSKRHGAVSVMEYEKQGFLPEALINYLVRLGWSHGDQEIFGPGELLELFDVDGLSSSAAAFDPEKLKWVNSQYIKAKKPSELAPLLARHLQDLGAEAEPAYLEKIVPLYQPRAQTMVEMAEQAMFFMVPDDELDYDRKAVDKFLTPEAAGYLSEIRELLAGLEDFSRENLEEAMRGFIEDKGIKFKAVAQPIRVAVTGRTQSPGLFETMEVLGRESVLRRMERALSLAA